MKDTGWQPLLIALGGALMVLALTLGPQVQATEILLQTVPTPTPQVIPTPTAARTPQPPEAAPRVEGGLLVRLEANPTDVLPGEEILFTLLLTNTSTSAQTGVTLIEPLDPVLRPLEIRGTQGAVQFQGQSGMIYLGAIEPGQTDLLILRTRVGTEARPGQIILNQFTATFDGGQVVSNVVAAGLPPDELPATGQDRRRP
jgi:uncharacterized repeat protein (TIGR01451 family)